MKWPRPILSARRTRLEQNARLDRMNSLRMRNDSVVVSSTNRIFSTTVNTKNKINTESQERTFDKIHELNMAWGREFSVRSDIPGYFLRPIFHSHYVYTRYSTSGRDIANN